MSVDANHFVGAADHGSRPLLSLAKAPEGKRVAVCAISVFPERFLRVVEVHCVMKRNCLSPSAAAEDRWADLRCEEKGGISVDEPIDRDTV